MKIFRPGDKVVSIMKINGEIYFEILEQNNAYNSIYGKVYRTKSKYKDFIIDINECYLTLEVPRDYSVII